MVKLLADIVQREVYARFSTNIIQYKCPYCPFYDHRFIFQDLSDDFRLAYSKFWMSILARDLEGMRTHSEAMGIGQLYPLLVCMVTGRTWNSVTAGVNRVEFSEAEVIT